MVQGSEVNLKTKLVEEHNFVQATRDSGYRGLPFALAELVDNGFDALASTVHIKVTGGNGDNTIEVLDNGHGMPPEYVSLSLVFGWSTNFNARTGLGRYGMGLPNSSLSLGRRVDVFSWQVPGEVYTSHLDLDEFLAGKRKGPHRSEPAVLPYPCIGPISSSGTLIVWSKCDRFPQGNREEIIRSLIQSLGRLFRYFLWEGRHIIVNGEEVRPSDPLFIRDSPIKPAAKPFGGKLSYAVSPPTIGNSTPSMIEVQFSSLPVHEWHDLSNREKRRVGITRGGGVSVVRAKREIDFGWYFMGDKRKENYDDWWRCEVHFDPDLDELFGITHTKQGIHPMGELERVLTPDISSIARVLNQAVRCDHEQLKRIRPKSTSAAATADKFLAPLSARPIGIDDNSPDLRIAYQIQVRDDDDPAFFMPRVEKGGTAVMLNSNHAFYRRHYQRWSESDCTNVRDLLTVVELLILAFARVELGLRQSDREVVVAARQRWGEILETFLREL